MRNSILIFFLLITVPCLSQENTDSARYQELLSNTRTKLREMSVKYESLENRFTGFENEFFFKLQEFYNADSLYKERINQLARENDSLENRILQTQRSLRNENQALQVELYNARKENVFFLITIFLFLAFLFVYFLHRNHQLKSYVNEEVLHSSLEMDRRHSKLRRKLKKNFNSFTGSMKKRFEKGKGNKRKKK